MSGSGYIRITHVNELGVSEERNTFFCRWNVLFQKKSKQGRLIELRGISSGQSSKKKRNFQGVIKKKSCGISRGIVFCSKNNLKSQGFLTPSPGWIFSEKRIIDVLGTPIC